VVRVDGLAGQAGGLQQRAQAHLVRSLGQHLQAELRDHAILADQGDHVGQRADGGDLDEGREPRRLAGAVAERLHQLERDADAGQVLVGIAAVVALRVDHGKAIGQIGIRLVVVGNDQVDAQVAGPARRLGAADAAVDRDDQLHPFGVQAIDGVRLQAIAVGQPLGDEVADVGAQQLERPPQDDGGGDAVNVVVAVDRNALLRGDGGQQPIGCLAHVGQAERVQQLVERRLQETRRLVRVGEAANGQQPGGDR